MEKKWFHKYVIQAIIRQYIGNIKYICEQYIYSKKDTHKKSQLVIVVELLQCTIIVFMENDNWKLIWIPFHAHGFALKVT